MMNPRTVKSWDAKIAKQMARIGAERDKLDGMIDELIGLRDSCETAWDDLHRARDALSELV